MELGHEHRPGTRQGIDGPGDQVHRGMCGMST